MAGNNESKDAAASSEKADGNAVDARPDPFAACIAEVTELINRSPADALALLDAGLSDFESSHDAQQRGHYCKLRCQALAMLEDFDLAIEWSELGLECFRACGFRRGEAAILNTLGIIASSRGDYGQAIHYESETLAICRELDFAQGIGHAANNIGLSFTYLGDIETALEYYEASLEAWKSVDYPIGRGNALLNLGFASAQLSKPDEALGYYREAEAQFNHVDYQRGLVICWRNMATANVMLGRHGEALTYSEKALRIVRTLGEKSRLANVLEGYAEVMIAMGRVDEARQCLQEAAGLYEQTASTRGQVFALQKMAHLPGTSFEEGIRLLHRALEMAETSRIKVEVAVLHKDLATLYQSQQQWEAACRHLESHIDLNRQVFTEKADQKMRTLRISHEFERASKDAEIERLRNVELASALGNADAMRRVAEEESRQKTEILRIAAHDLRNHTATIQVTAESAHDIACQLGSDEDLTELLALLRSAGDHLSGTLERILDVSAIEAGKISIESTGFNLWELISGRSQSWNVLAARKDQSVHLCERETFKVEADWMRTGDILDNLVSNALKYSPRGSTVEILLHEEASTIVCSVMDRGPGISEADQVKLYRPFQRLSARPTGGETTIGLGLYITQSLAKLQNGEIRYRARPGGGSCFLLCLPRH